MALISAILIQVPRLGLLSHLLHLHLTANGTSDIDFLDAPFDHLISILSQAVHILEPIVLAYGLIRFRWSSHTFDSQKLFEVMELSKNTWIIFSIITSVDFAVSVVPPSIHSAYINDTTISYTNDKYAAKAYIGLTFFAHFYGILIRTIMLYTMMVVRNVWTESGPEQPSSNDEKQKMDALQSNYEQRGQLVAAVQHVFQAWFVIKWIVYFISIISHSTLAGKAIFSKEKTEHVQHEFTFVTVHLICLLYTSPSPRDATLSRMPSSA